MPTKMTTNQLEALQKSLFLVMISWFSLFFFLVSRTRVKPIPILNASTITPDPWGTFYHFNSEQHNVLLVINTIVVWLAIDTFLSGF